MIVFLFACILVDDLPGGAVPVLGGPGFWDMPFPADARMVDGHPDLTDFPGGTSVPLFAKYFALIPELDGWGTSSPIFVRFESAPDMQDFPSPEESLAADSPVLLVDVDPASPFYGERVPVVAELREEPDLYTAENLLAILPVPGFPLRPHTEYALILRSPLALPGAMPEGWVDEPYWLDLVQALPSLGVAPQDVAAATVFTTQDPTAALARVAEAIQSRRVGRPRWEPELTVYDDSSSYYTAYEGHVTVPIWQEGERPYRDSGGGFVFDERGEPVVQGWERVAFALSVPKDPQPEAGWPLVIYSHGTGGDHRTFLEGKAAEGPAMAVRGVAMFGIAQPLHDDRGTPDTNVELDTFNFTNPAAGRTSFRQGAADQIWLAARLVEATTAFTVDGVPVAIDHSRLAFFGHSQGAMVGALGASWLSADCRAVGLSEAGGGTAASALLKVDPIPVEPLVAAAVGVESGTLTVFHPVLALVQMLSEVTDPINYGRTWFSEAPAWPARPVPVLLTEGLQDTYTPPITIEALATAAGLPVVGTLYAEPEGFALRGLTADARPAINNVIGWNGTPLTAGLAQFPDQGHFAIYYDNDAKDLYKDFLETSLAGTPELPK